MQPIDSSPPPKPAATPETFAPASAGLWKDVASLIGKFVTALEPLAKQGKVLEVLMYIVATMGDLLINKTPGQITGNPKMVNTVLAMLDLLNDIAGTGPKAGGWLQKHDPKIYEALQGGWGKDHLPPKVYNALHGFSTNQYVVTLRTDLNQLNQLDQIPNPTSAQQTEIKNLQTKIDKYDIPNVQKQAKANNGLWLDNLKTVEAYVTGNMMGWIFKSRTLLQSVQSLISASSNTIEQMTKLETGIESRSV